MKQFLFTIAIAFIFSACSADNLVIDNDLQGIEEDQAYMLVHVIVQDPLANNGGCAEEAYVNNVEGAVVSLFFLDEERPISADAMLIGQSDKVGRVIFEGLPEGPFQVKIGSHLGAEQRVVRTVLGKTTEVIVRL